MLEINGEITGKCRRSQKLENLRKAESEKIVVDLSKTTFIDSHGLVHLCISGGCLRSRRDWFLNPQGFIRAYLPVQIWTDIQGSRFRRGNMSFLHQILPQTLA